MTSVRLTWKGKAVVEAVRHAAKAAIDETTASATLRAQVEAPRDTGFMANTIEFQPAVDEGKGITGRFGNWTAEYSLFVEIGTSRMSAQPFLRPAASQEFPKLAARIRERMR